MIFTTKMPKLIPSEFRDVREQKRESDQLPLYVDLDGTLLKTDMLWETGLALLYKAPLAFFSLLLSAGRGSAPLKRYIAERVEICAETLPFNKEFLEWLKQQRENGRQLVLATAADVIIANKIADYLQIFDQVIASNGVDNLKGRRKLSRIREQSSFFDYAGSSGADRIIWLECEGAVPVCAPRSTVTALRKSGKVSVEFLASPRSFRMWMKAIRVHQWSKNLLVFVPLLTSHRVFERTFMVPAAEVFWAFNCLASATYLINDLRDLTADRDHPKKRFRALASGDVSIPEAIALAGFLGAAGLVFASLGGAPALIVSISYVVISLLYSFQLKQLLLIDVFTLAGLYTLRIIAGGVVTGIVISGWLMSFSVFLFLSLGFSKRATELLRRSKGDGESGSSRRAYRPSDFAQLNLFGVASGFVSSLVLALYVGSDQVRLLYSEPDWLWYMIPLFLYWITRLWLIAYRGDLNEDPVAFALKDWTTVLLCLCCLGITLLAASGLRVDFVIAK